MNATIKSKKAAGHMNETFHLPCVTIILPLEKEHYQAHLNVLAAKIEKELRDEYQSKAIPVVEKLQSSFSMINFDSSKKSAVICVSPVYEKTIYLDISLEEKVIIDEPFEIRDLVNSMYPAEKYLVLVQSAAHFKIFLGDCYHLMKIKVHIPDHMAAYKNDVPEKTENFSDSTDRKEIMLDKFIRHIDTELENILHKYRLPVFVIGTERMNGHFKKYTHNEKAILDYIHGNYDDAKPHQLLHLLQPYLKEIKNIENKELAIKIELALNENKFSSGIDEVWRNAMQKKGELLLVERNYSYPHIATGEAENLNGDIHGTNPAFTIDAVDTIIARVLEFGGKVKFVDAEILRDFEHIALFLYY